MLRDIFVEPNEITDGLQLFLPLYWIVCQPSKKDNHIQNSILATKTSSQQCSIAFLCNSQGNYRKDENTIKCEKSRDTDTNLVLVL